MQNKSKKLINNTFIFFIGSIGSKFIQFFLVPLYTYTLSTAEYGVTDIVLTTIFFLTPIFSVQISDGLLRFGLDKKNNINEVINSSFKIMLIGTIISVAVSPLYKLIPELSNWIFFFVLILNLRIYRDLLSIILKIQDKNKLYVTDSILYTAILCISNYLLLAVCKIGIEGYFWAYVLSNMISILFLLIVSKVSIKKVLKSNNRKMTKSILIYCLPLIVNSLAFWITTASDHYMLNWMCGATAVGIYAVASKMPSIVSSLTSVFSQAWLLSSINEYENDRDTNFYATTFKNYYSISFIVCTILVLIMKPFMTIYVSDSYFIAWKYANLLILSAVSSGIAAFLTGIYYAYKKNVAVTITTFLGAIVNIVLNIILIPKYDIMGASIATVVSWIFIAIIRTINIRKYVKFNVNLKELIFLYFLAILQIIVTIAINNIYAYIISFIIALIIISMEKNIIVNILKSIKRKVKIKK